MIETNPYTFDPMFRQPRGKRGPRPRGDIDKPSAYAPGCPVEERAAALEALAKMHRERPLRPPGR